MKNLTLIIILIVSAIIIIVAVGFNLFLVWNLLPIVVFYFVSKKYFNNWSVLKTFSKICLILLAVFLIIFPTAICTMWIFNIGEIATGSSTAGLIFIFIPVSAFVFSLIPYIILHLLGIKQNDYQNNEN